MDTIITVNWYITFSCVACQVSRSQLTAQVRMTFWYINLILGINFTQKSNFLIYFLNTVLYIFP